MRQCGEKAAASAVQAQGNLTGPGTGLGRRPPVQGVWGAGLGRVFTAQHGRDARRRQQSRAEAAVGLVVGKQLAFLGVSKGRQTT